MQTYRGGITRKPQIVAIMSTVIHMILAKDWLRTKVHLLEYASRLTVLWLLLYLHLYPFRVGTVFCILSSKSMHMNGNKNRTCNSVYILIQYSLSCIIWTLFLLKSVIFIPSNEYSFNLLSHLWACFVNVLYSHCSES